MMYHCSIATIGCYHVYQNTLKHHQKLNTKPGSSVLSHAWLGLSLSPDLWFCGSVNLLRLKTRSHSRAQQNPIQGGRDSNAAHLTLIAACDWTIV